MKLSAEKQINDEIKRLLDENKECMTSGNLHTYQCNCNKLKGIAFVMQRVKHDRK